MNQPARTENIGASKAAIQHHYDVSNDFYKLWLDPVTLAYSSALWDESDTLESAQIRKLDFHIKHSGADRALRVLDVGCGWGGILKRTREINPTASIVGLTLSEEQASYNRSVLTGETQVYVESWTDHDSNSEFDAIISIGAFEHFANHSQSPEEKIAGYRRYFEKCHAWLSPGSRMSLQTMTYENSQQVDFSNFFASEIFPESDLPKIFEIAQACDGLFEIECLFNHREHYARTYREWWWRLKSNRDTALDMVGEEVVERFDKYLQMMIIAFHTGTMGLARFGFKRLNPRN